MEQEASSMTVEGPAQENMEPGEIGFLHRLNVTHVQTIFSSTQMMFHLASENFIQSFSIFHIFIGGLIMIKRIYHNPKRKSGHYE